MTKKKKKAAHVSKKTKNHVKKVKSLQVKSSKAAKPAAQKHKKEKASSPQTKSKKVEAKIVGNLQKKEMTKIKKSISKDHSLKNTMQPTSTPQKLEKPKKAILSQPKFSGANGANAICREIACELNATTLQYCRMHYIKNWKKIKRKELILKERRLNSYIEELVSKYPDKYIEALREDLASEKDFAKVIADLEIDENMDDDFETDTEGAENIIDSLKRDFEEDEDF